MILVIAGRADEHAAAVIGRLDELGRRVVQLDTADLGDSSSLELSFGGGHHPVLTLRLADGDVDLTRAGTGWWRPATGATSLRVALSSSEAAARRESRAVVDGVIASLAVDWLNPPAADVVSRRTLLQWTVAAELGFALPRTIVTRDAERAGEFVAAAEAEGSGIITKSLRARGDGVRETHLIGAQDLDRLRDARRPPTLLQEYVEGVDLRVTVVGERVFAAEVLTPAGEAPWAARNGAVDAPLRPVELPGSLGAALVGLVQRLGLGLATVDLRRGTDGRHVFLDMDPTGEWLFVERRTGLPITDAVAHALAVRDRSGCGAGASGPAVLTA
ncbi:RimK family alpha-L-glutamate ligase [Agromyces sp. MMS24-JH15]|uniref:ATP-grasp domain-containing protein n=1 Tax=Agromyces sp. MMS24-JH15 TaxID=3243765 RepID=UPI00374914BB